MCQICNAEKDDLNGFNICNDCLFQMKFTDEDALRKLLIKHLDDVDLMLNDHSELSVNLNTDTISLILSVHQHLQQVKKVLQIL